MIRRRAAQYRHTAALSAGAHDGAWEGDVTLIYSVDWGCRGSFSGPAEGPSVMDWRVVAVDRVAVGPGGAPGDLVQLVEARLAELTPDLLQAAQEADDYAEEAYADQRREELQTTGVLW